MLYNVKLQINGIDMEGEHYDYSINLALLLNVQLVYDGDIKEIKGKHIWFNNIEAKIIEAEAVNENQKN